MPRKFAEIPPPADSSSEEEETESEPEEEEDDEPLNPRIDARNDVVRKQEETDEDDDDEEEEVEKSPPPRKATNSSLPDPDLDSESTQPSPSLSAFTIKVHKPSPQPNQAGSKRSKDSDSGLPAKKSKAGDDEPKKGTANARLWSEGDELAILDGLVKFKSEKGVDPSSDMAAFHDFIKDSLHVDVSRNQLIDKIRRLKKKYRTNIERGENGEDPVFSKSHEFEAFELSKKVWGGKSDGKSEIVKGNGKVQSGGSSGGVTLGLPSLGGKKQNAGSPNQQAKNSEKKIRVKVKPEVKSEENAVEKHQSKSNGKREEEGEDFGEKYPFLAKSLDMGNLSEGAKVILRDNLGTLEKSKLKELDRKWKSVTEAELEIFIQKTNLVNEQVKLVLDSIKS